MYRVPTSGQFDVLRNLKGKNRRDLSTVIEKAKKNFFKKRGKNGAVPQENGREFEGNREIKRRGGNLVEKTRLLLTRRVPTF